MSQQTRSEVYQPYSQPSDVADQLNMAAFTSNTNPTLDKVRDIVIMMDSEIDRRTASQFRLNFAQDERYDMRGIGPRAGKIVIRKQPVISIQRVQWFDGIAWHDALQLDPLNPAVTGSTSITETYFWYPEKNIIEFYKLRTTQRRQGVRISYTWGYTKAPDYIRNLSASMAAYEVHRRWSGQFNVAEDVHQWRKDLLAKINSLLYSAGGIAATGWAG